MDLEHLQWNTVNYLTHNRINENHLNIVHFAIKNLYFLFILSTLSCPLRLSM